MGHIIVISIKIKAKPEIKIISKFLYLHIDCAAIVRILFPPRIVQIIKYYLIPCLHVFDLNFDIWYRKFFLSFFFQMMSMQS